MYIVSLKQFDGPLDLLLTLITHAKVDIHDIFVSEITEQYLESMKLVDELDMDSASEFLQMAATLLEIKSRAMLPKPPKPEDENELSPEEALIRQLEDCAGQYQVAVQYGFKTLAAYLANHYRTREDLSEKLGIFTRAVQYLQYNAARPIKLQEVAEAAAVSQRHLERVFFEVCGLSPIAYLLELRLRHASLLLRGTSKTVAEIAGECGFEDPSYFARVFKRKYGAPPNQCRNAKAL